MRASTWITAAPERGPAGGSSGARQSAADGCEPDASSDTHPSQPRRFTSSWDCGGGVGSRRDRGLQGVLRRGRPVGVTASLGDRPICRDRADGLRASRIEREPDVEFLDPADEGILGRDQPCENAGGGDGQPRAELERSIVSPDVRAFGGVDRESSFTSGTFHTLPGAIAARIRSAPRGACHRVVSARVGA